jgi:hypothetical protein
VYRQLLAQHNTLSSHILVDNNTRHTSNTYFISILLLLWGFALVYVRLEIFKWFNGRTSLGVKNKNYKAAKLVDYIVRYNMGVFEN